MWRRLRDGIARRRGVAVGADMAVAIVGMGAIIGVGVGRGAGGVRIRIRGLMFEGTGAGGKEEGGEEVYIPGWPVDTGGFDDVYGMWRGRKGVDIRVTTSRHLEDRGVLVYMVW